MLNPHYSPKNLDFGKQFHKNTHLLRLNQKNARSLTRQDKLVY